MSWQATNWAVNQRVGNPARKLLLLVLANYADPDGVCWPSQGLLAEQTGMSLDTVQRQTKKLVADGFLSVSRPPKRRGQWQTFIYQLNIADQGTRPQNAAWSENADRAANVLVDAPAGDDPNAVRPSRNSGQPGRTARPHSAREPGRTAMRPKPSKEKSIEPSLEQPSENPRAQTSIGTAARLQAWQWEQSVEVVQNRIAQRLGRDGWMILVELGDDELNRLTELERSRRLDDATLQLALTAHRAARRSQALQIATAKRGEPADRSSNDPAMVPMPQKLLGGGTVNGSFAYTHTSAVDEA